MLAHATSEERSNFQLRSKLQERTYFSQGNDELRSKGQHVSFDAISNLNSTKLLQDDRVQV